VTELSQKSDLYKSIVGKCRILTPFKRHSNLKFFWDTHNKNALNNNLYFKARTYKNVTNVADINLSTNANQSWDSALLINLFQQLQVSVRPAS
jgi:hypothetical protein